MHQIRVHLQYLGFPIVNDPLYNHTVFGPTKGKDGDFGGKTSEELVEKLIEIHNAENFLGLEGEVDLTRKSNPIQTFSHKMPLNEKSSQTDHEAPDLTFDPAKLRKVDNCIECNMTYNDPNPEQLVMFLHALKYTGPNWHYETPLPYWAKEDFEYSVNK